MTQERPEITLRRLPRTRNSSGQPQARGAAPALRPNPDASETRPGHGELSTAPVSAAYSPVSKRPFDLQRSAATCEGRGGTVPPHGPPAHARASSGTRVRRLSPGTHRACDRGPPSTEARLARPPACAGGQPVVAVLLVRAAHPVRAGGGSPNGGQRASGQRYASHQDHLPRRQRSAHAPIPGVASRNAAEGLALTQEPYGSTVQSLPRREETQQRDRGRPSDPSHPGRPTPVLRGSPGRREEPPQGSTGAAQPRTFGSVSDPQSPWRGLGATGTSGTGRAQRRRCLPF